MSLKILLFLLFGNLECILGSNVKFHSLKLPIEEDFYYQNEEESDTTELISENEQKLTEEDLLLNCERTDVCPDDVSNIEKLKLASGSFSGKENILNDFRSNPHTCRCDLEKCSQFGDCCLRLLVNSTKSLHENLYLSRENPWKCHPLQLKEIPVWTLMISTCPPNASLSAEGTENSKLCTATPETIEKQYYTYLIDLPVFSNLTLQFYRNIFCALCNGEKNSDMRKYTLRLKCSKEFSPDERTHFQTHATYQPGTRMWIDGSSNTRTKLRDGDFGDSNVTCILLVDEFDDLDAFGESLRICGYSSIDTCSLKFPQEHRARGLCESYTQYVVDDMRRIYKNPHCYQCQSQDYAEEGSDWLDHIKCLALLKRFRPPPGGQLDGGGLNFIFDFGLSEGHNHYVGYNTLCSHNEVWDYVREQCHPMLCGKEHVLTSEGSCVSLNSTLVIKGGETGGEEDDDERHLEHEPSCYRILISEEEFEFIEKESESRAISINLTKTGKVLVLNSTEYEVYNETTVSICAKYLHEAFQSRFSPMFNYVSLASVGLSLFFLFLHILIYIFIPKIRNLPAQNLFCLTLSLFISQLLLLIFITSTTQKIICVIAAMLLHYFFLSAFFWMNSMSWDIWRTFSSGSRLLRGSGGRNKNSTFLKYSVLSWGAPLVIVSLAAFADFYQDSFLEKIKPEYGQNGLCWISSRLSLFIFFALPVAFVILSNLTLFSVTAKSILSQSKESHKVLHMKKNGDEVRYKLYIKLALIMGLTWILGFASAFLLWDWLWYAFVVLNGLQGTFIFFAFDFKKRTWEMGAERFGCKRSGENGETISKIDRRGTGTSTSSTQVKNISVISKI